MAVSPKALAITLGVTGAIALGLGLAFPAYGSAAFVGVITLLASAIVARGATRRPALSSATSRPHIAAEAGPRPAVSADHQAGGVSQTGEPAADAPSAAAEPASKTPPDPSPDPVGELVAPIGVEPSDALEAFVTATGCVGELLSAHMWLLDPATRTMRLVTAFGAMRPNVEPVPVDSSAMGEAAESGRALLRAEQRRSQGMTEQTVWRYAVPLQAGDASGCAALDFASEKPDAAALNHAAAMTRGTLAAALALHVARSETTVANTLLAAARELLRVVDPERIIQIALDYAVEISSADTASIMLLEPGTRDMTIQAATGLPDRVVSQTRVSEGEGISGWVLTTERSLVVEDLEDKGPRSRRHGVRSAMAVPICDEDGILGVLNVGSRTFHARFSSSQLASLESLGQVLGLSLRNAAAHETSRELYLETVRALALALETKDPYSRGATDRVHDLAVGLGAVMGLTVSEQQALRVASLLHDIGMAAAGDLPSAGSRPLSTVEWAMLKMHPVIAADVLEQAPALRAAVPIVYHHHEHYDGQGYVLGLTGEQIPIGARVLAVADAYVAMTSPRSYRPARSHAEAVAELEDKAGSQFDPEVVRALAELLGADERSRREF